MIIMEIKNVVNNIENEYPKMEQISKKHLSNNSIIEIYHIP